MICFERIGAWFGHGECSQKGRESTARLRGLECCLLDQADLEGRSLDCGRMME